MIIQYHFEASCDTEKIIAFKYAYAIYAWLLEQLPKEVGDAFHATGETPITQAIWYCSPKEKNIWAVNLLSGDTAELLEAFLDQVPKIELHTLSINLTLLEKRKFETPEQFLQSVRSSKQEGNRIGLRCWTPTAFKQKGRYTIFPSIDLILQSLIVKWNLCFPEYPLDDPDAIAMMKEKLMIVDYTLKTTRFPMKGAKIPGFYGNLIIESRLPEPLEDLWQLLTAFSSYAGLGIKTTLGMGAVEKQNFFKKIQRT